MVDIVMTSASDFENISSTVMDTSENENKNPIQNEDRIQGEDEEERKEEGEEEDEGADGFGDEMEEGEIFDDDDNKGNNLDKTLNKIISEGGDSTAKSSASSTSMLATPTSGTTPQQPQTQASQPPARKGRDFDREETKIYQLGRSNSEMNSELQASRGSEGSMLSSWMSGLKQRTKPAGANPSSAAPSTTASIDSNEEYYGYGNATPPKEGTADKDYRTRNTEHADKDYRWGSVHEGEAAHHHGTNQESHNEFGDSDYRSISPRIDRRRRRSPSPGYGGMNKRIRGHSPPMRGGYRGRGFRGRWGDRQICKFFREGYCRDGENCSYSHDAADSGRKPELCKFYQQGFCKKGLQCPLLHGEYPCKAFHKGECSKDPCQFSHVPLNNFTQPIFDQMMKDDELASRIAIPQAPLKRRVLIPGGPSPNAPPGSQSPVSSALTAVATMSNSTAETMLGGVVPPPSVVVPTLSTNAVSAGIAAVTIAQPQLVIPPALSTTTSAAALTTTSLVASQQQPSASSSTYPVFLQHAHLLQQQSGIIDPNAIVATSSSNALLPTMPISTIATTAAAAAMTNIEVQPFQGISPSLITEAAKDDDDDGDTSFNINKMLEQITSKVKKDDIDDISESPASPPMFSGVSDLMESAPTTIPQTNFIQWKLIAIDGIPTPHSNIDASVLQQSITDASLRNDPRIKKALSSQFDAFTNSLMRSALQPSQQQQSAKDEQQTLLLSFLRSAKAADPRMVAVARDPRKRSALIADPRTTSTLPTDPRLATASSSLVDPRTVPNQLSTNDHQRSTSLPSQTNGQSNAMSTPYALQTASTSSAMAGADQLYAPSSRDQDHRNNSSVYRSSPSHYRSSPPTQYPSDDRTGVPSDARRGSTSASTTSSWMPQMHTAGDPRFSARRSREYGNVPGYGSKDRDDREVHNVDGSGNQTAVSTGAENSSNGTSNTSQSTNTSSTNSSRAPISLREKRKNNEYESPLSRVPSAPSRWQFEKSEWLDTSEIALVGRCSKMKTENRASSESFRFGSIFYFTYKPCDEYLLVS
ncbi:unnamed protein product [Anisakis simplex]|uniref:Zinc finger CCCH domain-containing protein 6 n=1 Tax=Anisakis simplex TaxID=6269 RepID=A0A158PNL5_ANISI|nr:unnamed protein product [Anisakis simplex]